MKKEAPEERKRKRRNIGSFPCSECPKVFSRSDHLARHYLNHLPKELYVCDYVITNINGAQRTCGKTFVRKDLRERHQKRHLAAPDKLESGETNTPPENHTAGSPLNISNLIDQEGNSSGKSDELHSAVKGEDHSVLKGDQHANMALPMPNSTPNSHYVLHSQSSSNGTSALLAPLALPSLPSPMGHPLGLHPGTQMTPQHQLSTRAPAQLPSPDVAMSPLHIQRMGLGHMMNNMVMTPGQMSGQHLLGQMPQMGQVLTAMPNHALGSMGMPQQMIPPRMDYKPDYRTYSSVPQLQNDILSWLFTDFSPEAPRMAMSPGSPPALQPHIPYNTQLPEQDIQKEEDAGVLTPFYYNPVSDSVLNLGLQELNYFLNNDNPLDEVFFRSPNDQAAMPVAGEKSLTFTLHSATTSSGSPTNTNESLTPRTVADSSPHDVSFESTEKRIEAHAVKSNKPQKEHLYVDRHVLERMLSALQIDRRKLEDIFLSDGKGTLEDTISFYIYGYWEAFHPRFSILHRPSFDTKTAEPLLLLAMLLIGCMYCATSEADSENHQMCREFKCCMLIAVPLRFALFQHEDFRSPVKVWILQTLNLLEWCEKNYLVRAMHERAHIHHGTTVQLLRRSPLLGGNPTVTNKAVTSASDTGASGGEDETSDGIGSDVEEASSGDQVLFRKWVDSELMKRITFMTFYLDVIDYIKFRHNPQIPFFQLQMLNLPCDEEHLWNNEEICDSFRKVVKKQRKLQKLNLVRNMKDNRIRPGMNFLSALKRIMKVLRAGVANHKLTTFTKSILFGGIVSVMHQMQQTELQNNFTLLMTSTDKSKNQVWKEILTKVFDAWEDDMHIENALSNDPYFSIQKGQSKFPMYHLAQIIGMSDINHYDIAIYGGSPRNMSVDASSKDMTIVQRKLLSMWSRNGQIKSVKDLVNTKSVVHCYWLLWGLMLAPLGPDGSPTGSVSAYGWRADHDFYDAMYAVSIALLVLWCYVYSLYGVESSRFKDMESFALEDQRTYEKIQSFAAEDGYSYLFRVRQEFTEHLRKEGLLERYMLHGPRSSSMLVPLYEAISKYCEILPGVTQKQNISGLCFLVGTKLLKSQWQIVRENAKLIINCGLRSVGKKAVHCPDLFDYEFHE